MKRFFVLCSLTLFSIPANAIYTILQGSCTIGTSQQCATISAFNTAMQGTLLGSVTGYINENYNDTTAATFTGIKTVAGKEIYLTVNPSFKNTSGVWDSTKSSWTRTTAGSLFVLTSVDYFHIDGLQMEINADGSDSCVYINTPSTGTGQSEVEVKNCIVRCARTSTGTNNRGFRIDGGGNNKILCNVVSGFNLGSGYGITTNKALNGINAYIYSNSVTSCTVGIGKEQTNPNFVLKNNISVGNTDGYSASTWGTGSDYNASNIASDLPIATQTHSTNSATTSIFVDQTNNNLTLVGNDLWVTNKGIDLSTDSFAPFSTDITGTIRPQGVAWDMGAFEYVSPAPPVTDGTTTMKNKWGSMGHGLNLGIGGGTR